MKKWIIILVMGSIPMLSWSQNGINQFFQKYKNAHEAEHFRLGGLILDLAVGFTDDEDAKSILKKIKRIRLLSMDKGNPVEKTDYKNLIKSINDAKFSPLIKIKDGKDDVNIYVQERNNYISEILILLNGEDEFLLLNLSGKLKFEDLNDLDLDIKGSEHLDSLPDTKEALNKA